MDIDLVGISPLKDTYSTLAYIQTYIQKNIHEEINVSSEEFFTLKKKKKKLMSRSQITDAEPNKRGKNHDSTTTEILRSKARAAAKRGEIIFSTAVSKAKNEV